VCANVKSLESFKSEGCTNCEEWLGLSATDSEDKILECTTTAFSGLISVFEPEKSWVSKWHGAKKPGLYALKVYGTLPEYLEDELERREIERPMHLFEQHQ